MIREIRFFAIWFGLPFLAIQLLALLQPSPLSIGRRLFTLEDTCAYGFCFIIPLVIYAAARVAVWVRER